MNNSLWEKHQVDALITLGWILQLANNVSMKLKTIEPAGDFDTRQNRTDVSKPIR